MSNLSTLRRGLQRGGRCKAARAAVRAARHHRVDRCLGRVAPELKGSIGEGPNHSNFSHQSSVNVVLEFRNFC